MLIVHPVTVLVLPFNSCCSVSAFPRVLPVFSVVPSTFCVTQALPWSCPVVLGLRMPREPQQWGRELPTRPREPFYQTVSFKAQLEVVDTKQKVNKHFPGVLAPRSLFLFPFAQSPAGQQPELLPTHPLPLAAPNNAVVVPAEEDRRLHSWSHPEALSFSDREWCSSQNEQALGSRHLGPGLSCIGCQLCGLRRLNPPPWASMSPSVQEEWESFFSVILSRRKWLYTVTQSFTKHLLTTQPYTSHGQTRVLVKL